MISEPKHDQTDEALISSTAGGDLAAFGTLYSRYLEPIYRYIYYRVSNVHDSEDLTEEVFVRAWSALQKAQADPGIKNFRAWLYRIAHNLVVDHHRQSKGNLSEEILDEENLAESDSAIEEILVKELEAKNLEEALLTLEDPLQQIIILRFINGMSHAETAEIVGLKEGHVRVLQYRALKRLRNILEKDI